MKLDEYDDNNDVGEIPTVLKERDLKKMDFTPNKSVAFDPEGNLGEGLLVTIDEAQLQKGYEKPFKIVLNGSVEREGLLKSVKGALSSITEMKNPRIKGNFVSWFCSLFKFSNDVFDNEENLNKGVDQIVSTIENVERAHETVNPAQPLEVINFADLQRKEKQREAVIDSLRR